MKNIILKLSICLLISSILFPGCKGNGSDEGNSPMTYDDAPVSHDNNDTQGQINWMSWEEAIEKNQNEKKKIFVDMYTDWCGWCKKMDASTFKDSEVANYMNENFHPVKFNAEQKGSISFRGQNFEFTKAGRRGAHGLAVALLDGRLGYPSFVFLDENLDRISISPGFKKAEAMLDELNWVGSNAYKKETLDQFLQK